MQFSGDNIEYLVKPEVEDGAFDAGARTQLTTLTKRVFPGNTMITVASTTGYSANNYIMVGNQDKHPELLRVRSANAAAKTITLQSGYLPQTTHGDGEAVAKVTPTLGGQLVSVGNVTSFAVPETAPLAESQAFLPGGVRAVNNVRQGRRSYSQDVDMELNLRSSLFFLQRAIGTVYTTVGTARTGSNTTLSGSVTKGATTIRVASASGITVGTYLHIATVGNNEVLKVKSISGTNITLNSPLRYDHNSGRAISRVQSPFTHVIKKGINLPIGFSTLTKLEKPDGSKSLLLLTGNKINTLGITASGSEPFTSMSMNAIAKNGLVYEADPFDSSNDASLSHIPYVEWEGLVKVGGAIQASNYLTSLTLTIENNVVSSEPFGGFAPGRVQSGLGRITGSFDYEFHDQDFLKAVALGEDRSLEFVWHYSGDDDHELSILLPKVRFGGVGYPSISERAPITDSKEFTAVLDPAESTDITITAKTDGYSLDDIGG